MRSVADVARLLEVKESQVEGCYVLGSTGIAGASTRESDVDLVVVLKNSVHRKWRSAEWLMMHGWMMPTPRLKEAGFQRDYKGSKAYDVWIYTRATFQLMLDECVPFAVECMFAPAWRKAPGCGGIRKRKSPRMLRKITGR